MTVAPAGYTLPIVEGGSPDELAALFGRKLPMAVAPTSICDFCCAVAGVWTYPCADFVLQRHETTDGKHTDEWSLGSWCACDDCAAIVETGDVEALTQSHLRVSGKGQEYGASARIYYANFFAFRLGPRLSVEEAARCEHPKEALRFTETNATINPHHHPGLICTVCGVNLAPELFRVRDGWHRKLRVEAAR